MYMNVLIITLPKILMHILFIEITVRYANFEGINILFWWLNVILILLLSVSVDFVICNACITIMITIIDIIVLIIREQIIRILLTNYFNTFSNPN